MTSEMRPGQGTDPTSTQTDRRISRDRRAEPTRAWGALFGHRRRRMGRRQGESEDIYVDAFSRRSVLLLVVIFGLNICDAFFTMIWLQRGGGEANPFMNWLLELGVHAFLIQKCLVVGLWLLLLLVHKNFRLARIGLWSALGVYSLLILYHFALIASGVDPAARSREAAAQAEAQADKRLEETPQQGRHGALDAQGAHTETDRGEARGAQALELVVAPAALRSDGE